MRKFIISSENVLNDTITFSASDTYHIAVVLRKKPGDSLECIDQNGTFYSCILKDVRAEEARADIIMRTFEETRRTGTPVTLIMPLLKNRHTEMILQKGTEMGVDVFAPYLFKRSVIAPDPEKKFSRYEKIIHEACKQCGRGEPPELLPLQKDVVPLCGNTQSAPEEKKLLILAWEQEKRVHIKELLRGGTVKPESIVFAVGPEGGITNQEVESFRALGFLTCGLGPLILRAETAALYGIAVCKYEFF